MQTEAYYDSWFVLQMLNALIPLILLSTICGHQSAVMCEN
jgi:hypothetical protein